MSGADPACRRDDRCRSVRPRSICVMAELTFELVYDGPALAGHEMDARDFARAVLSTANLFQEMNRAVRPYETDLSVNIRATSPGSFNVVLKLLNDSDALLIGGYVTGLVNLEGLLSLFSAIVRLKRFRHRSPIASQQEQGQGQIHVAFADGTTLDVPAEAVRLADQLAVSRDLQDIVRPLDTDGVDTLTVRRETVIIERLDKSDVAAVGSPIQDNPLTVESSDRSVWLQIRTVTFQEGNKWRFWDGSATFAAVIDDVAFIDRIENGEAFRKGDRLHCLLRETQWFEQERLHVERRIVRVLEHRPGITGKQLQLGETNTSKEPPK